MLRFYALKPHKIGAKCWVNYRLITLKTLHICETENILPFYNCEVAITLTCEKCCIFRLHIERTVPKLCAANHFGA